MPNTAPDTEFDNGFAAANRATAHHLRQFATQLDGRGTQSICKCKHGPGYHAPHCHHVGPYAGLPAAIVCGCERYWNAAPDGTPDPSTPRPNPDDEPDNPHIADTVNAMLHRPFGSAPCTTACTHVISGQWTALGIANVLRHHAPDS
jgi:hypothetical protein